MARQFVHLCSAAEIKPGSMKRVKIDAHALLVANVNDRYYAVDDTCTHEEASLSSGSLKGELVKCPLHGSRFSVITGEVLDEPAEENLRSYRVKLEGENLWVEWEGA